MKETQAAIERLMRWCAAKNKEPALPLEERAFVMDIEMVYTEAAKHMQPGVPVSELRKWQDDLKIAVGETTEYPTRIMLEIIIDDIDELIEANTQEVF